MKKKLRSFSLKHALRHACVLFCLLLSPGEAEAFKGQAKDVMERSISISFQKETLHSALQRIKHQTGTPFAYDPAILHLDSYRVPVVSFKDAALSEVLSKLLTPYGIVFSELNGTIILTKGKEGDSERQQDRVSGKVTDESGVALPGVTVLVKGTVRGTSTAIDGTFSLAAPGNTVLVFSYIGYESQEVHLNGRTVVDIQLKPDVTALKELVVIGYGTQKREDITSAIGSFKPTIENSRPVLGPDQMLQGRIAGVNITPATGLPGSASRVSIRGIGSLSASNEPLYVVDGIPLSPSDADLGNFSQRTNPLSSLNPNDIESIEVLKDAASASIYGSRATNGVVLITTKKGTKGKSRVSLNAYTGMHNVARLDKLKMAGSDLYVEVINEAIDNYNMQNGYSPESSSFVEQIQNPYPGRGDTDWLDLVLRTAYSSNINMDFSGGTDKSTYYISGGYTNQQGTVIDNVFRKYNAKISLTNEVKPWLNLGVNTNFTYSRDNRIPGSYSTGTNVIPRALEQRPFDQPYKPDGSYYVGGTSDLLNHNPLQGIKEEKVYLDNYRILGNLFAEFRLTDNLRFKSTFGTDWMFTQDYVYYKQSHPYGTGKGRILDDRRTQTNLLFENTANYNKQLGSLSLDLLAGHSFQRVTTSLIGTDGRGFPSPSFDVNTVAAEIASAYTNLYGVSMQSFYGRANLGWDQKYLLNLSVRADGSSRFSPENRYGYFPAASAGWVLSKEPFWGNPQTDLKLRVSYGATGNLEGVNAYAYQALTGGGYNYNNSSGIAVTSFGNRELTWEKATQFNGGVDLGLLRGRINLTADYFIKNTNNLLYSKPTYGTTGFTSIISNIGSMRNWGIELGINTHTELGPVRWDADLNIAAIRNRLTSLLDDDPLLIGRTHVLKVGEEVGSFYVYRQLGIYQTDEEVPENLYASGIRAGDVKYEDVNGDGKIDLNDRQIVGSANPDFSGGFNNTFRYKNFDLSIFTTFSYGNKVYETWTGGYRLGNGLWPMLESEALNRWTGPGTSNTTPRAIWGNTVNSSSAYSTRFLHDGSYLRFRTVSLGYNLPETLLSKASISQMRVYVQADNPLLLTSYPLLDPEVNISLSPSTMGEDFLLLPQPRTFIIGVNIGF